MGNSNGFALTARPMAVAATVALLAALISVGQITASPSPAGAALPAGITATKVGWDVMGLNSNGVNVGPNQFPNGVRVCNTNGSGGTITGSATWTWTDSTYAANIYLADDAVVPWSVPAGECQSIYWTVEIARLNSSYFKSRGFSISVTDGTVTETGIGGPNRSIYVEKLVSQNRNTVGTVTGPGIGAQASTPIYQGREYTYSVTGATAPGGYEQLEFAAVFDSRFFEILQVSQTYASNSAPASRVPNPNYQMYADACGWNYIARVCTGTGKTGGSMTSTYRVRVIGSGTSRINTLIYDFSGSSYHYNADFGSGPTVVTTDPVTGASLSVEKQQDSSTYQAGDTIRYSILVTNNGDDTVTGITLDDTVTSLTGSGSAESSLTLSGCTSPFTLAPGAARTCTAQYRASATDDTIVNYARARGTSTTNPAPVSADDSVTATYSQASLRVSKAQSRTTYSSAGQAIDYTVTIANDGDTTLTNIVVDDVILRSNGSDVTLSLGAPCSSPFTLAPTQTATCTATYTTSAGEVLPDSTVTNTVTVAATPQGGTQPISGNASVTAVYVAPGPTPAPGISITKSASAASFSEAGDVITYAVVAKNTGNTRLDDVTVSDPRVALTCSPETPASLEPSATITCTGRYTTTAADVAAGRVDNLATAAGTDPDGAPLTASDGVSVPLSPDGALEIDKSAEPSFFLRVGDRVGFTIVATNVGATSLRDVTVDDPTVTLSCTPALPVSRLAPGASITCRGGHVATQEDVDAGGITNTATARGRDRNGTQISDRTTLQVPGPQPEPALNVAKYDSPTTFSAPGERINYRIVAANIGNVTLTDVRITDPLVALSCTPSAPVARLAPGQSIVCVGSHTTTQADVDAGFIANTATVAGTDPAGNPVRDTGEATTQASAATPRLKLTKQASPSSAWAVGQKITYAITATNTGDVTIHSIVVTDPLLGAPLQCSASRLAPRGSLTCKGTYVVTKADLNRGSIPNTASATGTPARGLLPPARASLTLPAQEAWIKADVDTQTTRQGTVVTVDDIRTSSNLTSPRIGVTCAPTGSTLRGDFAYCTWTKSAEGVVIRTAGRPVEITVTIRAQLKGDPNTWVTKKYVIRTTS